MTKAVAPTCAGKEQMDEVWDLAVLSIFLWLPREKKKKRTFPVGLTGTVRPQQDHQRVKTPQGACGLGAEVAA